MRVSWLIGLMLSACATRAPVSKTPDTTPARQPTKVAAAPVVAEEPVEVAEEKAGLALALPPPQGAAADAVLGVIDRAGLVAIVDAGLGRLFQKLQVSPAMKKGRFVGFQITSMHPDWSKAALKSGDVIMALNGMPVERPEQAMAAFESLRQADQLVIDVLREGVPLTFRYRIE